MPDPFFDEPLTCPLLLLTAREDTGCRGACCAWFVEDSSSNDGSGECSIKILAQRAAQKMKQRA